MVSLLSQAWVRWRSGAVELNDHTAVSSAFFGMIERLISTLYKGAGLFTCLIAAHPKTAGDLLTYAEVVFLNQITEFLSEFAGIFQTNTWCQQCKFFPAPSGQKVALSDIILNEGRNFLQNLVPRQMTVFIVNHFEVIDIKHQNR